MLIRCSILIGSHIFIYSAFVSETAAIYSRMRSPVLPVLTMALCIWNSEYIHATITQEDFKNLSEQINPLQLLRNGQK